MLFQALRPALFAIDPERAHRLTIAALKVVPLPGGPAKAGPTAITVAGIAFPNPVGLAAGFDKDAEVPDAMLRLGFGSVEIGSVTPLPQAGNPRPRLFRLAGDAGVINRMGFNNGGAEAARERLARRDRQGGIVGINIGANKDAADRIADYATMARIMAPLGDYLTVNVSSPNTPGLRNLQQAGPLADLLDAVLAARGEDGPPVFLKVAPDLEPAEIEVIARVAIERRIGALIVGNTTISRPPLKSRQALETGGLSGAPLAALALQRLRDFYRVTVGELPLVGVGGIASAEDAWQRIRAGASLVQLYSALVYQGPGLARHMVRGLATLMRRDGFSSIAEAVGSERP